MSIDSVYILLSDGRCLFSLSYTQNTTTDPHLLGGLLSAFNAASKQYFQDPVRKIISEGEKEIIIKEFDSFLVALVGKINSSLEAKMDIIGMKFLSKYGDSLKYWSEGEISQFKDFKHDINLILKQELIADEENFTTQNGHIEKDKYLDALTIIALPSELQKTALSLLLLHSGTAQAISKESGRTKEEEESFLSELLQQGYINKKTVNQEIIYFVS